jgi:hypothetical protein
MCHITTSPGKCHRCSEDLRIHADPMSRAAQAPSLLRSESELVVEG